MEGQGQKRGVKAEWEGGAGENFPSVKADRKERFQGQMSCTLGRGQEERTVDASTVRAEDEWVRRLLQGKKNLAVGKPVQDLVPGTFAFNSGSAPLPILSFSTSWQKVLFWPHHSQQCLSPGLSIL